MSATEQLLEQVKEMDEKQARAVLDILSRLPEAPAAPPPAPIKPAGAAAMRGYARKYNHELKTTEEWMKELRGGEAE